MKTASSNHRVALVMLVSALWAAAGLAQQQPAPAAAPEPQQQAQAAAAPPSDGPVTGSIDFGYRWTVKEYGNNNMYRSIVNLGDGPKLFDAALSFRSPRPSYTDRIDVQLNSWGGEPYSTARVSARKEGSYELGFAYRNISYYNNIPSFANPLLESGLPSFDSQNGYDIHRRLFDVTLDIFPNRRFSPYFVYSRSAGTGPGLLTFVGPGNEYLSNRRIDDAADVFRAGSHLNFSKANFTLEFGGSRFRDDLRVFYGPGGANPGNRRTPLLGETLRLDSADQQYGGGVTTFFTRHAATLRPFRWMDLSGEFLFNQPSLNSTLRELAAGNLVSGSDLRRNTGQTVTGTAQALHPHPSGTASLVLRPLDRLRIVQSYYTDRFHLSSFSALNQNLTGVAGLLGFVLPPTVSEANTNVVYFSNNYNRYQAEAMFDLHPRVTLRGGYRKIWSEVLHGDPSDLAAADRGRQRQQVALTGVDVRLPANLTLFGTAEVSSGDSALVRTSLLDYQRVKVRGRWKPLKWATVNGTLALLRNFNGRPDINLAYRSHESSLSLVLSPGGGKRLNLTLDYMHSALASDMFIILVPFFDRSLARYDQNGHQAGAYASLGLTKNAKIDFGGNMVVVDGSRPTRFYQPQADLVLPFRSKVSWIAGWRFYDFSETQFRSEAFRSHLFLTGLRITM
jgi:hypothetical protein